MRIYNADCRIRKNGYAVAAPLFKYSPASYPIFHKCRRTVVLPAPRVFRSSHVNVNMYPFPEAADAEKIIACTKTIITKHKTAIFSTSYSSSPFCSINFHHCFQKQQSQAGEKAKKDTPPSSKKFGLCVLFSFVF